MPKRDSTTLWKAVSRLLVQKIRNGKYPIGLPLPREVDLAVQLNVSRNTVREAMRALAADGLVVRRRRAGTVVIATGGEQPIRFNIDPFASLERRHSSTQLRVLKRELSPLPEYVRTSVPSAAEGNWLRVTMIRTTLADERPLAWQDMYLHPRLHQIEPLIDREREPVFKLIEKKTGERLARIDTSVRPCRLTKKLGRALQLPKGALALLLTRQVFNDRDEMVEFAEGVYPEERYQIEVSFNMLESAKE